VNKTLIHAFLDPAKPLPTHYGGIRGLTELGASTVELLVLPNIVTYMSAMQSDLNADERDRKRDAEKVRQALLVKREERKRGREEEQKSELSTVFLLRSSLSLSLSSLSPLLFLLSMHI
jgi:hypothetical protein